MCELTPICTAGICPVCKVKSARGDYRLVCYASNGAQFEVLNYKDGCIYFRSSLEQTTEYKIAPEPYHEIKAPCGRCSRPGAWLQFRAEYVDRPNPDCPGHREFAIYLRDAPDALPATAFQNRPYDERYLHRILPYEFIDANDPDFNFVTEEHRKYYHGPLTLAQHQCVMEAGEFSRTRKRSLQELRDTWELGHVGNEYDYCCEPPSWPGGMPYQGWEPWPAAVPSPDPPPQIAHRQEPVYPEGFVYAEDAGDDEPIDDSWVLQACTEAGLDDLIQPPR